MYTLRTLGSLVVLAGGLGACQSHDSSARDTTVANGAVVDSAAAATTAAAPIAQDTTGHRWTATLAAPSSYTGAEHVSGTSTVVADSASKSFRATVSISDATPNSTHPWHVHKGTCASSDGIVGPASAYTPIHVDASGKGKAAATVSVSLPADGSYIVNVHESPSAMKTIVACGALTQGGR